MPEKGSPKRIAPGVILAAAALGLACSPSGGPPLPGLTAPPRPAGPGLRVLADSRTWYEPASTRHDFGRVLAGADSERRHVYRVVNISERTVRVSRVVNMKPCCGDVASVDPVVLGPGQGVEVTVTLKVGPAAGRLQHLAVVETDDPDDPEVGLTTRATCLPRATIDEVAFSHPAMFAGENARIGYVIHSHGDGTTSPLDLDDRTVRCNAPIQWSGPQSREIDPDTGAPEHRRGLVVTLEARGEPGPRATDVLVMDGNLAVARKRISWEVAAAIKATPSALIVSRSDGESLRKVFLRSRDGQPFRILSATARVEGLDVRAEHAGAKTDHVIEARLSPTSRRGTRTGDILVATDHTRQPEVRIAVYVPTTPEGAVSASTDGGSR